jgi:hypothetical protein
MIASVLIGLSVEVEAEDRKRARVERREAVELDRQLIKERHALTFAISMPGIAVRWQISDCGFQIEHSESICNLKSAICNFIVSR